MYFKINPFIAAGLMPVATTNTKGLAPAYFVPLRVINETNSKKLYEICTLEKYTSVGLLVAIKQYTSKCYIACISANRHNTSGQILYATNEFITGETLKAYINKTTNKLAVELPSYFSLYVLPLAYNGNVQFNLTETTDDGYVLVE